MRIISGYCKGLRLCSFSADFIRPMTDRVKTSVFNVLYSECGGVDGKRVLDLFSGTGSLGLEALSRGAGEVYMVDSHKKSIQIIKKNSVLLNKASAHVSKASAPVIPYEKSFIKPEWQLGSIKIYQKDAFRFLTTYKGKPFDLIFADPPFKTHYGARILKSCIGSQTVKKATMIVLEISTQEKAPEETNSYHLKVKKKFGDKQVLFYSLCC